MLTGVYHYDLVQGLFVLGRVLLLVFLTASIRYSFPLIRSLGRQDESISEGRNPSSVPDAFFHFRKFVIFLIGYRGERREATREDEVDFRWMRSNWYFVLKRFFIFYSIYITFGIILTRPVYFSHGHTYFYHYDQNNLRVFGYLLTYIVANSVFDYLSLLFTFRNLGKIIETGRVFYYGMLGLGIAILCFIPSQLISCLLWYLKRRESNVVYSSNYLFNIIDITLWPYGLVGDADTNTILGPLFPGQLIITGTVFFPTIMMMFMALLYYSFLRTTLRMKQLLVYARLDSLCKAYLKISLSNVWSIPDGSSFGYCNTALILILNAFLMGFLYDQFKALMAVF